jgi:hypothetical protein
MGLESYEGIHLHILPSFMEDYNILEILYEIIFCKPCVRFLEEVIRFLDPFHNQYIK